MKGSPHETTGDSTLHDRGTGGEAGKSDGDEKDERLREWSFF